MNEHYIYDKAPSVEEAILSGFFHPKEVTKLPSWGGVNYMSYGSWGDVLSKDTLVLYYPGSFGSFHQGHCEVILEALHAAKKIAADVHMVISPSNSDYLCEKYGPWSTRSSNKHRYDEIRHVFPQASIDLEPMLNYRCDQNFTDLLQNFVKREIGCEVSELTHKPWIVCGKDRECFKGIENFSDEVRVFYDHGSTNASTSRLPNVQREKKNLILRVESIEEYDLFREYFHDQYLSIEPVYLHQERFLASEYARINGIKHTICRQYSTILSYVQLSRTWTNPLLQSSHFSESDSFKELPIGTRLLDSDIFTGSTEAHVKRVALGKLHAIINAKDRNDVEIVDIWDLQTKYAYPHVDITSRCSMQAFDYDMHKHFEEFTQQLRNLVTK